MNVGKGEVHYRGGHEGSRGIRGIALPFNLGTKCRGVVNATCQLLYSLKDPVPTVQDTGWAPEPVWTGAAVYGNISEGQSTDAIKPSHAKYWTPI